MNAPGGNVRGAVLDAYEAALAGEHRAVFGYGVLGPRLSGDARALAAAVETAHEQLRDTAAAAITAAGRAPVGPRADYPELFPVDNAARALRVAVDLEQAAARAWRYLYATAAGAPGDNAAIRAAAQNGLTASAVRQARWSSFIDPARATTPFPGI